MAKCRVRFFIPKDPASTDAGVVDLKIDGNVTHFTKTLTNPVYTARPANRIAVFESATLHQNADYVTSGKYTVKEWEFNSTKLSAFQTSFDSNVESYSFDKDKKCTICSMSDDFIQDTGNDFTGLGTVAFLTRLLGHNAMWNYYSKPAETNYLSYLPASLQPYGDATKKWTKMAHQHDI